VTIDSVSAVVAGMVDDWGFYLAEKFGMDMESENGEWKRQGSQSVCTYGKAVVVC